VGHTNQVHALRQALKQGRNGTAHFLLSVTLDPLVSK